MSDDDLFDNEMEKYLHDNHGNLNRFYSHIAGSTQPGMAFQSALSRPDIFRLRKAGKYEELRGETEFDSPAILRTIEWLKADLVNYPEDHPLWSMR